MERLERNGLKQEKNDDNNLVNGGEPIAATTDTRVLSLLHYLRGQNWPLPKIGLNQSGSQRPVAACRGSDLDRNS